MIYYTTRDELYYMRYRQIQKFWDRAKNGGRKSIRFDELESNWFMELKRGYFVPYLDCIQKTLTEGIDRLNETSYNIRKSLTN